MQTILPFVFAAAAPWLLFAKALPAQEGEPAAATASSPAALAASVRVKLDKAIGVALQARPGFAAGVELESRTVEGRSVPVFEIMVCGKDDAVFEVFVNAIDGAVVGNEPCQDAGDVEACKALLAHGAPHVTLAAAAAEARALLRGTCIGADYDAKAKTAKVTLVNRERRVRASWSAANGELLGVAWMDRAAKHETAEKDDDEAGEAGEHGEKAEGAKARKGGKKDA